MHKKYCILAGRIIKKTRRTSGSPAGCIWTAGRRELLGLAVVDGLVAEVHDQIEHDGADVDKIHDQDIVDGAGDQLGADAAEVAEERINRIKVRLVLAAVRAL